MMYKELRRDAIPCLSFMSHTGHIMYVGPELTTNELAKLHSIDISVPVIYMPELVKGISKEVFEYNFPGVAWPGEISWEMIFSQIRSELGEQQITPESRLIMKFEGGQLVIFDAKDSFSLAISYLINKCDRSVRFSAIPSPSASPSARHFLELPDGIECSECCDYDIGRPYDFSVEPACDYSVETADDSFDDVMYMAAQEVRDSIRQLLLSGFSASIIRSWLDEDVKLSRLRITRQFKILLVDYDKEIKMGPLPKTVFLFFLRHPEGVRFSYLQDYVQELKDIYGCVSKNDDLHKMNDSITALVDPFNNSINEKCAAVKKAFILQIDDRIARNYYISGVQGEEKGIPLDRSLVEWECEL